MVDSVEAGRITMDLAILLVMSMYSVLGIILVRYIALHILLSGGIKLFDLLCISL
jgi:hypothetical protein